MKVMTRPEATWVSSVFRITDPSRRVSGMWGNVWERLLGVRSHAVRRAVRDLPWVLLTMFFVSAWLETFPLTAYTGWLNVVIGMSQETQNNFYAVIFFPWAFKTVYGWLSDTLPIAGYRRRSYLMICNIGSAAMYAVSSLFVTTVVGAFGVTFCRALFNAFSQLLLGASLMDIAGTDIGNAGLFQVRYIYLSIYIYIYIYIIHVCVCVCVCVVRHENVGSKEAWLSALNYIPLRLFCKFPLQPRHVRIGLRSTIACPRTTWRSHVTCQNDDVVSCACVSTSLPGNSTSQRPPAPTPPTPYPVAIPSDSSDPIPRCHTV